jgi:hypothetical protein
MRALLLDPRLIVRRDYPDPAPAIAALDDAVAAFAAAGRAPNFKVLLKP